MQPIIGITSGTVINKDYPNTPAVMGQQYTYVRAIVRAGGVPVVLPIVSDENVLRQLYGMCSGIVFAGGNDIDPQFYNEAPSPLLSPIDADRDRQELKLWEWAKTDDKAVLAICRGMQLINVGNGGSLHQDIPTEIPSAIKHRIDPEHSQPDDYLQILHKLQIKPDSKLAAILSQNENVSANAFHHQAIKKLGEGLEVTATTEDDVIEGLEMPSKKFVVGVQSHPESLEDQVEPLWRKLFTSFVQAAS
jgi:putative glutamine amidotransferase